MDAGVLLNHIISLVLLLYGDPNLPRVVVQTVISAFNSFIRYAFLPSLKRDIITALKDENISKSASNKIEQIFEDHSRVFDGVLTEATRFSLLENKGLIEHEEFPLGTSLVAKLVDNDLLLVPETCYGVYVPLRKSLKLFLEIPGMLNTILKYISTLSSETRVISNIIQGKLWVEHYRDRFAGSIVLPIYIFFDDLEVGNPLGSHAGTNKFGALYTMIACLPPHIASRLNSIVFTMLVHSAHKKQFSNRTTFQKLIDELNYLATSGITVVVEGIKHIVKFQLVLILGDNLGLNGMLGFTESFNANHSCRICKISYDELLGQTVEEQSLLRNRENYEQDVNEMSVSDTGIKERCVFHDVHDFHITQNVTVDVMHDVLEGVCLYVMRELLYKLIFIKQYFTVHTLNERISNFQYGPTEMSNKPPALQLNKIKLKQLSRMSASEMLCFVRYLGLIIGDLVLEGDDDWRIYQYLRQIIDILTSPRIISSDIIMLKNLIEIFNSAYIKLYGPLKPKFHNLVHYPAILSKNGPCINFWSMRCESRHKQIKANAQSTHSTKNLLVTIAKKQTLQMCHMIHALEFENNKIEVGSLDKTFGKFKSAVPVKNKNMYGLVEKYNFVHLDGKLISIGQFIVTDIMASECEFGEILEVLKMRDEIFVYVQQYRELFFDEHVHAYIVEPIEAGKKVLMYNALPNFPPLLSIRKDGNHFLASRYKL